MREETKKALEEMQEAKRKVDKFIVLKRVKPNKPAPRINFNAFAEAISKENEARKISHSFLGRYGLDTGTNKHLA